MLYCESETQKAKNLIQNLDIYHYETLLTFVMIDFLIIQYLKLYHLSKAVLFYIAIYFILYANILLLNIDDNVNVCEVVYSFHNDFYK